MWPTIERDARCGSAPANGKYVTDFIVIHRSDRPQVLRESLSEALDRTHNTLTYRAPRHRMVRPVSEPCPSLGAQVHSGANGGETFRGWCP